MALRSVPRPAIILFLLVVSIFTEHSVSASGLSSRSRLSSYSLRRLRSRISSLAGRTSLIRTPGLFLGKRQVLRLQENRVLRDVFAIEGSQVKFPFAGTCRMPVTMAEGQAIPQCAQSSPRIRTGGDNWFGSTGGCCNTVLNVELPQIVTSVITGQRHQVLQFSSSSQLVHSGHCENEGGMCVLGGRCTTVSRIQWLLVRSSPLSASSNDDEESEDEDNSREGGNAANPQNENIFVPTVISNHCQCVFT